MFEKEPTALEESAFDSRLSHSWHDQSYKCSNSIAWLELSAKPLPKHEA